jgi:hypothetical protein
MKKRYQTPVALLAAIMLALSGPGMAFAGHGDDPRHGHHAGKHSAHHDGYGKRRSHGHRYGHGHGGQVSKNIYKYDYDDDDDGGKFLLGLLFGGIAGYAVSRHNNYSQQDYASYPPRYQGSPVERYYPEGGDSDCLQEREYTNKVIIGGKTVDAYGTACLQPDGSWRYGPAELASY